MSDYKIAIKIAGQLEKSFGSSLKAAQAGLKGIGKLGKIGATGLAAAGTAIAAVAGASINVGRDFEAAMSSTAATAGATAEEYDKLKAAAMEMGRTTSKTATESANALEYMALAGWSVDDSIKGLPGVLRLSEATGLDLARTSDLVTDSMSACGVSVDELSGFLDICAKANNKSNQTAEQLMEAYIGVGGTMKNLNVSTAESATALGVLANRGIKGSEAGTALNAIMTNLTTGTGQAGKMMEQLGLSAFDSQGNFIGMEATLQQLNGRLAGMTDEERNAALAAIGGKHHVDALNALLSGLNETTEDGSTEWANLYGELTHANGALEEMAATKMDNLNGDLAILQSALQDCGIRIYDSLQEPLRSVTQYGTSAIYRLSDALQSGGFEGLVTELGGVLSDGVATIASYGPQFVTMATNLAMSFLAGIRSNSGKIAQGAVSIGAALLMGLIRFIPAMVVTGAQLIAQFLAGAAQQLPAIMQAGVAAVGQMIQGILSVLPSIIASGISIILTLAQGLIQALPLILAGGLQAVVMLVNGISQAAPALIQAAIMLIGQLLIGLVNMLPVLVQSGLQLVVSLVQGLMANLPLILQMGVQLIISLINAIGQSLPMIAQAAIQIIISLVQGLLSNLGNIVQAAVQLLFAFASGILQAIPTVLMAIPQLVSGIIDTIFETDWLAVGGQLIAGIKDGVMSGFKSLIDGVKGMWGKFTDWITGGGDDEDVGEAMAAEIEASTPEAVAAASSASQQVAEAWKPDYSVFGQYGQESMQAMADGYQFDPSQFNIDLSGMESGAETLQGFEGIDLSSLTEGAETLQGLEGIDLTSMTTSVEGLQGLEGMDFTSMTEGMESLQGLEGMDFTNMTTSLDSLQGLEGVDLTGMTASMESLQGLQGIDFTNMTASMEGLQGLEGMDLTTVAAGVQSLEGVDLSALSTNVSDLSGSFDLLTGASEAMTSGVSNDMTAMTSAISSACSQALARCQSTASGIRSAFASVNLYSSGTNMMQGLINGINAMRASVEATARNVAQAAASAVNSALAIKSPSRVLAQSGRFAGQGLVVGMEGMAGAVKTAATQSLAQPVEESADQMQRIEVPEIEPRRSAVIGDTLQRFGDGGSGKQKDQPQEGGGATFVFSPTYRFEGEAPSKEDVMEANRMSQKEFERMMKEYLRGKGRVAFG
nr:phage tail tape measure protein [uncultured Dysosmobacter sp.]